VKKPVLALLCVLATAGCATHEDPLLTTSASAPPLRAIGYATVSVQPGRTASQKQLNAIRAARLAAMRDLVEKIYGADVSGRSSVIEGRIVVDTARADVEGMLRGVRVVRIQPFQSDVYEAELEVSAAEAAAMRRLGRPHYQ
jgi:hypothetical protein